MMNNLQGIHGLHVHTFEIEKEGISEELDMFLRQHGGNVLDIQSHVMAYGVTKIIVVYTEE